MLEDCVHLYSSLINKLYGYKGTKLQSKPRPQEADEAETLDPVGERDE